MIELAVLEAAVDSAYRAAREAGWSEDAAENAITTHVHDVLIAAQQAGDDLPTPAPGQHRDES